MNSKNEGRLGKLQHNFKCSHFRIIGVPEEEEEEQEIENLFEKIMKKNFCKLAKELPKEFGPMEAHTKAHHNYITQD